MLGGARQEDKDFAFWGVDFEAYAQRARELGIFLDRRPVRFHFFDIFLLQRLF